MDEDDDGRLRLERVKAGIANDILASNKCKQLTNNVFSLFCELCFLKMLDRNIGQTSFDLTYIIRGFILNIP